MTNYCQVRLGKRNAYAEECFAQNFIGTDYGIEQDLSGKLPEEWRKFNREFIPVFLATHPDKSKIGAGLACGAVWKVSKGLRTGDVVLCPDGAGRYRVGRVSGDYFYKAGGILPHRRGVDWLGVTIDRADMSDALRNSAGSIGTVADLTGHGAEIETLIAGSPVSTVSTVSTVLATAEAVEDPAAFVMEKHLEDFLVQNWTQTDLGATYDIFEDEGERVGQQYATDTGPIDILAISKDRTTILVVELKRGRASDVVVGQTLRYMGFVRDELAEEGQHVEGAIVALDDDQRIRRALAMVPSIAFYRYQLTFKLTKA